MVRKADYDVIVIGAGIVGVSTALQLQMRGKSVLLLDRGMPGAATSFGNSGIIETSNVLPFALPSHKRMLSILFDRDPAVRLHYPSLPSYLTWINDFYFKSKPKPRQINGKRLHPLIGPSLDEHRVLMRNTDADRYLRTTGRVKLHRSEASFVASALEREVATATNVPFDVMDAHEFTKIEPSLKPIYHKAVRWTSSARLTDPAAVTNVYADKFARDGGSFQKTTVHGLIPMDEAWLVSTESGKLAAKDVVISTGPWATDLLRPLGYKFPMTIKRGYHQHFPSLPGASLSHAIVDADIGYLICPMDQGYRITTGIEFSGIKTPATPVQIDRVMPFARQLFPLGDALDAKAWLGNRPCFTDSLPIVGEASSHKNLWFNFGHGHSGLTIGPSSGRLLAELLCGQPTFCDAHPYRSTRFSI